MNKGFFISFEGGEGSGKTSQINRLAEFLTARGYKTVSTREPGGTPEAEKIRDLLVKRDGGNWSPEAETLLLYAARSMHAKQIIRPALDEGNIVITDRFSDSTLAYQGYGHGYPLEKIKEIDNIILSGLKPNLTFLLDIDPEEGIKRSTRRLTEQTGKFERMEDRFEKLDIEFHKKLRKGFLDIAKENPERCHIIDAAQSMEQVTQSIIGIAEKHLDAQK
jgi:dTMP kinase